MSVSEIMGSRETTLTNKMKTGVKLIVTDTAGSGAANATIFTGDDNNVHARRCVHVKETPRFLADLILIVEQYQGPLQYGKTLTSTLTLTITKTVTVTGATTTATDTNTNTLTRTMTVTV